MDGQLKKTLLTSILGGNYASVIDCWNQGIQETLYSSPSLYMVFEVMFEISIPFIMATLLDKGGSKGGYDHCSDLWSPHVDPRLSLFSVGCSRLVMGLLLQLALLRTYGRRSLRRSKLSPSKTSIASHLRSGNPNDDGCDQCAELLSDGDPICVRHRSIWFLLLLLATWSIRKWLVTCRDYPILGVWSWGDHEDRLSTLYQGLWCLR